MFSLKEKMKQAEQLKSEIEWLNKKKEGLQEEVGELEKRSNAIKAYVDYGQEYIPAEDESELEYKRCDLQNRIIGCVSEGIYKISQRCQLNNSYAKGKQVQKAYGDGLIYSLNAYIDSKEKSVTLANFEKYKRLIEKKLAEYQKKAIALSIVLNEEYVELRIEKMKVVAEIKAAKKYRLEEERAERAKIREELKLIEEAEAESKRLRLEREAMDVAFAKALTEEERDSIMQRLERIDKRLADIDYRINNQRAGYLYIIETPALPDMVKIGATRRLNPAIRVKELSSSSLPFPFEMKAFCFCDDVFTLESEMHNYFDEYRVSPNREFFYVKVDEAINVLKNKFNQEIHWKTNEDEE